MRALRSFGRFFLSSLIFFLGGCATPGGVPDNSKHHQTVERHLSDKEFQVANQPIRTLAVALFLENGVEEKEFRSLMGEVSALLEQQVGVRLEISLLSEKKQWKERSLDGLGAELREFREAHQEYDIVLGVLSPLWKLEEKEDCWYADEKRFCVIGRTFERRNISITRLTTVIILHEVGHTLLQDCPHAPVGVMYFSPTDLYFTVADREVILKTKWRDFREKQVPLSVPCSY